MSDKYPHPYTYYSVIKELDPKSVVQMDTEHDDLSTLVWLDGNPNDITTEQIEAKKQELIDDWDNTEYQRDRKEIYPEVGEQLDMLWHAIDDGDWTATKAKTTDFYTKLKKVKDDIPKG